MANCEHIRWLRKGVAEWNNRRKSEDFAPDLCGANIPAQFGMNEEEVVDLTCIDLKDADLSNASLRWVCLRRSDLRDAQFEGADLTFANLKQALASGVTNFNGATLKFANLRRADLLTADLRDADLSNARLEHARLVGTQLSGANLSLTHLWNAELFPEDTWNATKKAPIKREIRSIADLLEVCRDLREKENREDVVFYFRGESCDAWELSPSLMRNRKLRKVEGNMLIDLMSRRPEEFDSIKYALGQWVLAQHHGLPTRLLDVTRNPLVALFHACEKAKGCGRMHVFAVSRNLVKPFSSDTISVIANFAKLCYDDQQLLLTKKSRYGEALSDLVYPKALQRLYHLIRQEKPNFQEKINPKDLFRVFIVEPQQSFERIRAQSGAFLISAFHDRFEPCKIRELNAGTPVYDHFELGVPQKYKDIIIEDLSVLNINREILFPGIDEAARAVTGRFDSQSDICADES